MVRRLLRVGLFGLVFFLLHGCATPTPENVDDVCSIFREYPKWYWATRDVYTRWRVPIAVQMAIMHQESRFQSVVKPARTKLFGFIPWKRPSSAYGYSQALDGTWKRYKDESGNHFASRDNFADAANFIGWYGYRAHRRAGIDRRDAYRIYLAYHEGVGGFERKSYLKKPWLMGVAKKVQNKANVYQSQLNHCQSYLLRKPWWRFW